MTGKISLHFSGGLELLFNNQKAVTVDLLPDVNSTIALLLHWIRKNLLSERPELFMQGDTIRPGILVLINDCDWEVEGSLDYVIQPNDAITFISTLHGG